eukprot:scaffold54194_cov19-Tisochrysis_lutea.AAC.3
MLWELAVVAASAGTANTRYNSRNAVAGSAVAPMAGASSPGVPPIMSVLGYEQKGGLQDNQKKLGTGLTVLFFKLVNAYATLSTQKTNCKTIDTEQHMASAYKAW